MHTPLLIPIENQVRELDPKLLLATCAAKSGISSYIGYRTEMDIIISSLPRGMYLAKSFTQRSDKMFRILSKLGHTICAWDEEALVHYPPDIYFKRRLSKVALSYISHLFTWGQDNEDLLKQYNLLPNTIKMHKVGNPRLDMLRKEFSYYFDDEVGKIKNQHGNFVLINTNFGNVNAHLPIHNLFTSKDERGNYLDMGRGATGMGREFCEGRAKFKQTILDCFKQLIPFLSDNFNNTKFIIRPHPVENKEVYFKLAKKYANVEVVQKGNVIPWIRASKILIHSGCTTGIEAYLSGKPSIAYVPIKDARYGYDALMPDELSHQCPSLDDIELALKKALNDKLPPLNSEIIKKYIEYDTNQLCSEKIVDILTDISPTETKLTPTTNRLHGHLLANKRRFIKRLKGISPKSKYHSSFQNVRFPTLSENQLQEKINKFAQIINSPSNIRIKQVSPHIFLVQ